MDKQELDKLIKRYVRKYFRAKRNYLSLQQEYKGDEMSLTFHAGRNQAMHEFTMYTLEDVLYDLGVEVEELKEEEWIK
jgi:hypothetical protein